MKSELISIIVLVYNTEKYITRCINSIINQTYQNLEIIAINDGSTDKSSNKLKRLALKDKRIRVIERENRGRYLSRLEGYRESKGKYILYIDGDDWINRHTVQKMYEVIKDTKVDVVRCQDQKFENDNLITPKSTINRNVLMDVEHLEPQFFDLLYKTNYCNTICKQLMKKSVMKNISKVEENLNYCEDLACNLEIYKKMKSILFMPDELYIHNLNNSYKTNKSSQREVVKEIKDTIYTYYSLFSSITDFDMKNKSEYKKFAAMKFNEKLMILISKLAKTHIPRRKFNIVLKNVTSDKRVMEIYKTLDGEDLGIIFNDMKDIKKKVIKKSGLLINKEFNKLYNYNKFFHPFRKVVEN